MLTIDSYDNTIEFTRADTGYLQLVVKTTDGMYEPEEGDTVTFSIKKSIQDEDYVLRKTFKAGDVIVIEPEDTAGLEYGRYKYDVQIDTHLGEVFTVVADSVFKLTKEVNVNG